MNLGDLDFVQAAASETLRLGELGRFSGDWEQVILDTIVMFTLRWDFQYGDAKRRQEGRSVNISSFATPTPTHTALWSTVQLQMIQGSTTMMKLNPSNIPVTIE